MSLLKNLMVDTKSAWVEFPGLRGFEVEVANIPRDQLIKLRKSCIISKFDRKTRASIETLDEEKFVAEFSKAAIKNWKGLTLAHLETLLLIDSSGQDLDTEIPYSQEDAETLVSKSGDFDQWINDAVFDLENFRSERTGGAVEPSGKVAQ